MNHDRLAKLYRRLAALHASQARLFEELAEEVEPTERLPILAPPQHLTRCADIPPDRRAVAERALRRVGESVRSTR